MSKIAIAQTTSSENWRDNIQKAKQFVKKAEEEKAWYNNYKDFT